MILRIIILLSFLLLLWQPLFSQRTNFGAYFAFPAPGLPATIKIDKEYIFPKNSYKAFYINEKLQKTTRINANVTGGFLLSRDYRLFSISSALVYSMRGMKFEVNYPAGNGDFLKLRSTINLHVFEIPLEVSYVIINGCKTRLRINAGIGNGIGWGTDRDWIGTDINGNDVFKGIAYRNKPGYHLKAFTGVSLQFRLQHYQCFVGPRFETFSPNKGVGINNFLITWMLFFPLDVDESIKKIYVHEE